MSEDKRKKRDAPFLLTCPFCGRAPKTGTMKIVPLMHVVYCPCATKPTAVGVSEAEAVNIWNRRHVSRKVKRG